MNRRLKEFLRRCSNYCVALIRVNIFVTEMSNAKPEIRSVDADAVFRTYTRTEKDPTRLILDVRDKQDSRRSTCLFAYSIKVTSSGHTLWTAAAHTRSSGIGTLTTVHDVLPEGDDVPAECANQALSSAQGPSIEHVKSHRIPTVTLVHYNHVTNALRLSVRSCTASEAATKNGTKTPTTLSR
jgi:hypothetical protein